MVFWGAPFMCVFVYGWNNWDFVIFSNAAFGEIKDHSLRPTPFKKKKNTMEDSSLCLLYVKTYFEEQQLSAFFFMAQITQIFLFSGMPLLERSKITVGAESHRSHFLKII